MYYTMKIKLSHDYIDVEIDILIYYTNYIVGKMFKKSDIFHLSKRCNGPRKLVIQFYYRCIVKFITLYFYFASS